mmetsp:Transcript_50989/g.115680  ORF Transcript_50989/g.115680 Transcript_50989/m.115680 type:complete len:303 (+) Transcript_50989:256-1164(+)
MFSGGTSTITLGGAVVASAFCPSLATLGAPPAKTRPLLPSERGGGGFAAAAQASALCSLSLCKAQLLPLRTAVLIPAVQAAKQPTLPATTACDAPRPMQPRKERHETPATLGRSIPESSFERGKMGLTRGSGLWKAWMAGRASWSASTNLVRGGGKPPGKANLNRTLLHRMLSNCCVPPARPCSRASGISSGNSATASANSSLIFPKSWSLPRLQTRFSSLPVRSLRRRRLRSPCLFISKRFVNKSRRPPTMEAAIGWSANSCVSRSTSPNSCTLSTVARAVTEVAVMSTHRVFAMLRRACA